MEATANEEANTPMDTGTPMMEPDTPVMEPSTPMYESPLQSPRQDEPPTLLTFTPMATPTTVTPRYDQEPLPQAYTPRLDYEEEDDSPPAVTPRMSPRGDLPSHTLVTPRYDQEPQVDKGAAELAQSPREPEPLEPPQTPKQEVSPPMVATPPVSSRGWGPTLTLEFEAGGEAKVVKIREQPLGLQFAKSMPLTVSRARPHCSGAKAGVQEGWVFVKIGHVPLQGLPYEAAVQVLKTAVQLLEQARPGFLIEFQTPTGSKAINFDTRPLDLTFDKKMPIKVKKVVPGGKAEMLRVQVDWLIRRGNDKDLFNVDFDTFMNVVKEGTKDLPQACSTYFVDGRVQG